MPTIFLRALRQNFTPTSSDYALYSTVKAGSLTPLPLVDSLILHDTVYCSLQLNRKNCRLPVGTFRMILSLYSDNDHSNRNLPKADISLSKPVTCPSSLPSFVHKYTPTATTQLMSRIGGSVHAAY